MDKPSENALAIIGPQKPKTAATDQPLPLDAPAMDGAADTITIDLTAFETKIDSPETETAAGSSEPPPPGFGSAIWQKLSPISAPLALATVLGILAGTAATVALMPAGQPAPVVAAVSDETRILQDRVTKLSGDLTALKSGLDTANRNASAQLGKIGERLDRAEKAQAEPAAKLAKIVETLDRLERRTASAATSPADITGSVTSIEKQQTKPPAIEGWRLHDFYAGRVVLENRTGTLYEVGPGSTLPGVGKIETIKRVDGKVVITTPKGTITSSLDQPQSQPRRQQHYLPPGYY